MLLVTYLYYNKCILLIGLIVFSERPTDLMIGSLTIVVLIVVALFLGMLVVHKRKAIGIFKRSNSYLGNDFSMKINMKVIKMEVINFLVGYYRRSLYRCLFSGLIYELYTG